ncbi:MAG TPA: sulfite exporter TauE/SafE family protein, partial [Gammaproteobacteria bacterium]|nr:sulfite exporter TauE/SafE family protein [Gammaproteobacteria bacterium]
MELIPPELSMLSATGLVALSFFTSMLTAAIGIGGGLLMLTVMVSFLPPIVVLPVHGVIQLGSNSGRMALMRRHVDWRIWGFFAIGSILGVILAGQVFINLSLEVLRAVLGLFVLYAVWTPKLRPSDISLKGYTLVGVGTAFITMF